MVPHPSPQVVWLSIPASALVLALLAATPAFAGKFDRPKLRLQTEDGSSAVEFHMAAQFRWEYTYEDQGEDADRTSESKLKFRRIRTTLRGNVINPDLTWLMHLSVAPGAAELMDLWLDYRLHPQLQVKMGQFKIPFTRHRLNSFQDRPVVEWSWPNRYFGAERQLGVMAHNGLAGKERLEYQLGVFTGVNARAANGVGMNDAYAEPIRSQSLLVDPAPLEQMHTEFALHVAYNHGGIKVNRFSDLEGGPARFSVGLSAAWDLDSRPGHDMRMRLAPEVLFKFQGLALAGVFYLGLFDERIADGQYLPGFVGGLLQASYVFDEIYELALRYTAVHLLDALRDDARVWADSTIADAADEDVAGLTERFARTGLLRTEHELNLGFNIYLFGTTLKWQTDVGLLMHDLDPETLYDLRFRTQLQLAF